MKYLLFVCLFWGDIVFAGIADFPEPVVPLGLGVSTHFHHAPKRLKELDLMVEAGLRFGRTSVTWERVERQKGIFDFKPYRKLTNALLTRGIKPLFILAYANPLYDGSASPFHQGPSSAEIRSAFARYAAKAVSELNRKGVIWEIWNEPNIRPFWKPDPKISDYISLVKESVIAIRKVAPRALIIGPALACGNKRALNFLEESFRQGLLSFVDGVSLHPYRNLAPETVVEYYTEVKGLIKKYAPSNKPDIPIICSEWGYSTTNVSAEQQANYAVRSYLVNLSCRILVNIWYDWRDSGDNRNKREHNFGLLKHDYTRKPAYKSIRTLTRALEGYTFIRRLPQKNDNDWVLLFKKGSIRKLAVWTTERSKQKKILIATENNKGNKILLPLIKFSSEPKYIDF